jgi:hypothetical protein
VATSKVAAAGASGDFTVDRASIDTAYFSLGYNGGTP